MRLSQPFSRTYRAFLTISLFVCCPALTYGQNFEFSQFFASRLYLNPAFAGAESHTSFSGVHRSQWTSIDEAYISTQASVIHPFYRKDKNAENWGGGGISLVRDAAANGNLINTGFNGSFAYNLAMKSKKTDQHVTFGMMLGILQKEARLGAGWGDQYRVGVGLDPSAVTGESGLSESKLMPDIGIGASYNIQFGNKRRRKNLQIGLSGFHLNSPNESLVPGRSSPLPPVIKSYGRLDVPSRSGVYYSPNFIIVQQAGLLQVNPGMSFAIPLPHLGKGKTPDKKSLILGVWHRLNDSFIWAAGINSEKYTLAFSFDLNSSSLRNYTNGRGAVELSFAYRYIKKKKVDIERKRFDTPRM